MGDTESPSKVKRFWAGGSSAQEILQKDGVFKAEELEKIRLLDN